jgi:hypothetical protein
MSEEVVVKIFNNEIDAGMARDVLKDEGITASLFKDDGGGMEPHLQRTRGVRLVVKPVDADRARKILQPLFSI